MRLCAGERGGVGTVLRPWHLFVLALLAATMGLAVAGWPWIDAQARATFVLSSLLETPVLTPAVETLTREPRLEDTVFEGNPTLIAEPGGLRCSS
jgi:hypothetical protein